MPFSRGRQTLSLILVCAALMMAALGARAQEAAPSATPAPHEPEILVDDDLESLKLDQALQGLKDEAIEFNRDAEIAEDEYLFPPETRLSIYLSNDFSQLFLDKVSLTIDNDPAIVHEYSEVDAYALQREGALQRLVRRNISRGGHRILLTYSGHVGDPESDGIPTQGRFTGVFDKHSRAAEIELRIQRGARRNSGPIVRLIEWSPDQ